MNLNYLGLDDRYLVGTSFYQSSALADLPDGVSRGMKNADPFSYSIVAALAELFSKNKAILDVDTNYVGLVVIGDAFPKATTIKVLESTSRRSRVSPIDFINANAGAAISYFCTQFVLRGPTLNLVTSTETARLAGERIANRWLDNGHAHSMFCLHTSACPNGESQAFCRLLSKSGSQS